jgi:hypothetical protein
MFYNLCVVFCFHFTTKCIQCKIGSYAHLNKLINVARILGNIEEKFFEVVGI